jgi:hypothetical protein
LNAVPGQSLQIPVNVDSIVDLTGNGLESADLVLFYDPRVIDVTGVSLGSLLESSGGWMLASRIDPLAGRVFVSVAGPVGLEGRFSGELVKLQATVKADAPAGGSAINLAATAPTVGVSTQLNEGFLTLIPAPTDGANDPVDGLLTIAPVAANTNHPTVSLVNNNLVVNGTAGDDMLLIARLSATQVLVRAGNRLLGTFATPDSIAVDASSGQDYVYLDPGLAAVIATADEDAAAGIAADFIVAQANVSRVRSPLTSAVPSASEPAGEFVPDEAAAAPGTHDFALLQLLDQWTADGESSPLASSRRRR